MNPLEYEKRIKEQRSIDAANKNLSGSTGKIGVVLRFLGESIVEQSEGDQSCFEDDVGILYRQREMQDLWLLDNDPTDSTDAVDITNRMLTQGGRHDDPEGPEWTTRKVRHEYSEETIGLVFDGLQRGMHLEIKYTTSTATLTAHWKGHLVFKEVGGDLRAYLPDAEWEEKINLLYEIARPKQLERAKAREIISQTEKRKDTKSWMRSIIERWGSQ